MLEVWTSSPVIVGVVMESLLQFPNVGRRLLDIGAKRISQPIHGRTPGLDRQTIGNETVVDVTSCLQVFSEQAPITLEHRWYGSRAVRPLPCESAPSPVLHPADFGRNELVCSLVRAGSEGLPDGRAVLAPKAALSASHSASAGAWRWRTVPASVALRNHSYVERMPSPSRIRGVQPRS